MFRPPLYHLQGILHQAHKTQKNYQIDYKFMVLKFVDIVKFAVKVVCRICFDKNVIQGAWTSRTVPGVDSRWCHWIFQ
jgi:hypothetical protein